MLRMKYEYFMCNYFMRIFLIIANDDFSKPHDIPITSAGYSNPYFEPHCL